MSRYYCHEYPDVLVLETHVIDARPGAVLLERSPFHPGGGGQLADRGVLRWNGGEVRVTGCGQQVPYFNRDGRWER